MEPNERLGGRATDKFNNYRIGESGGDMKPWSTGSFGRPVGKISVKLSVAACTRDP